MFTISLQFQLTHSPPKQTYHVVGQLVYLGYQSEKHSKHTPLIHYSDYKGSHGLQTYEKLPSRFDTIIELLPTYTSTSKSRHHQNDKKERGSKKNRSSKKNVLKYVGNQGFMDSFFQNDSRKQFIT